MACPRCGGTVIRNYGERWCAGCGALPDYPVRVAGPDDQPYRGDRAGQQSADYRERWQQVMALYYVGTKSPAIAELVHLSISQVDAIIRRHSGKRREWKRTTSRPSGGASVPPSRRPPVA